MPVAAWLDVTENILRNAFFPTGEGLIVSLRPWPHTALFQQMCTVGAAEGMGLILFYNSDLFQDDLKQVKQGSSCLRESPLETGDAPRMFSGPVDTVLGFYLHL